MNKKKINLFLVILLFFILSLNALYADDDIDSNTTSISNANSPIVDYNIENESITEDNGVSDNNIADDVKLSNKNVKKDDKITVNNYEQLYDILTDDTNRILSIELQGDMKYNIDKQIEVNENIISLSINGNNRILDGNNEYSFMKINNQYSRVYLYNINVINCKDTIGSVFYNKGILTVTDSSFINNTATSEAGVIYNYRLLTVDNCIFENNDGGKRAGAISNRRNASITNSLLKNNTAVNGGSIYLYGNTYTLFENNIINASSARFAGSIFSYGTGNTSIINNNISYSTASLYGGVLLNHGSNNLTLSGNNFSNNKAVWGGVVITLDKLTINNNNFNNNTADYGSVIFNDKEIQLNDNNFTNNNATIAGCIYNSAESVMNIINNNFKNNTAGDGAVIYNSGECVFNNNTAISNTVRNNDGYVIKSDTDLINDDSEHKIEIKNNEFINNTDYKRDMLFYNNATSIITNNKYTGNYLDLNISNLDKLSYTDKINTTLNLYPSDKYNTTLNTGKLLWNVNGNNYQFNIKNNISTINLTSKQLDNQNNVKISYNDSNRSFNLKEKTYNISVYKNTMITIKADKNVPYRDVLNISVNVTDLDKKIIDKGYVIYKINGITLTDDNGIIKSKIRNNTVTLNYQLPKNYNIKEYNLEVIYSGNPDNYNVSRNSTKFNIIKTTSTITVTKDKKTVKMDENITFTAKINTKYQINEGVMLFKVNGVTVKDKNNNPILVNVTNNTATLIFTIPDGWSAREIKVTTVYSNKNFKRLENNTYFNITKTKPVFNISSVNLTTNTISVKGKLVDTYGHYVSGVNTIVIKINSLTLKQKNNKAQVFIVNNGVIDINYSLLFNLKKADYKIEFVTGERNAYTGSRLTITVKSI